MGSEATSLLDVGRSMLDVHFHINHPIIDRFVGGNHKSSPGFQVKDVYPFTVAGSQYWLERKRTALAKQAIHKGGFSVIYMGNKGFHFLMFATCLYES